MAYNDVLFKAYDSFVGGQNSSAAPDNLMDKEVRKAVNVDVVNRGALVTRNGTRPEEWACLVGLADSAGPVRKFAEFSTPAGLLIQLVLVDGNLYNRESTTPLLSDCGTYMDFTVYNNKMYMFIKDSYYTYDGTTFAEVTNSATGSMIATVKKCKYIVARADRIFAAGNPESPNSLYYSQVGDPTYFKSGDHVVQAASADGDYITGIAEFNETILVFKSRGVWAWFGYSVATDVKFTRLNVHTGTRHERTIANVANYLFFLGEDGVYAMTGTASGSINTTKVSGPVDDQFKNFARGKSDYDSTAVACYADGKYYLGFTEHTEKKEMVAIDPVPEEAPFEHEVITDTTTLNNKFLVCHVEAGIDEKMMPWTEYTGIDIADVMKSGDGKLYFAVAGKPAIYMMDPERYSDYNNEKVAFEIILKDYNMDSPIHLKKFKRLWVRVSQYQEANTLFDVKVKVDYRDIYFEGASADESLVWEKGDWTVDRWGWVDTVTKPFKLSAKGLRCSISLTGDCSTINKNRMFLYGVAFMYKAKKPYKESEV